MFEILKKKERKKRLEKRRSGYYLAVSLIHISNSQDKRSDVGLNGTANNRTSVLEPSHSLASFRHIGADRKTSLAVSQGMIFGRGKLFTVQHLLHVDNTGCSELRLRFDVEQADGRVGIEGRENYLMWVLPRVSIVAGGMAVTTEE